jgi:hypothetical protein
MRKVFLMGICGIDDDLCDFGMGYLLPLVLFERR